MLEGERGCLNHITCLPFHLTAAPLGNSLFTLASSLLHVLQRERVEGTQRRRGEMNRDAVERVLEVEEGQRQNEVVESKGE